MSLSSQTHILNYEFLKPIYFTQNQPTEAEEWLLKAKKIDPHSYTVDNHIGM